MQAPAWSHRRDACGSGTGMARLLQPITERQASRLLKPTGLFFLCVRREMLNVKDWV